MFKWTGEWSSAKRRIPKMEDREKQTRKLNKTIKKTQERFLIVLVRTLIAIDVALIIIGIVISIRK